MKQILIGLIILLATSLSAQSTETFIELLRSDIQAEKKVIVAEAMELSSEQSEKFWPIYNEFQLDASKLGDKRVAIIKEYAENYDKLTNEVAENLIDKSFDLEEEKLSLNKKYYKKVKKVLDAKYAGKFLQLINRMNMLIDIQLSAEIPLIPIAPDSTKNK
ncbi:MAG: hypothetical protein L3J41_11115 [Melioribacteraceae bacterium]|nr:hypothetical protein [Melioribacteraceae bacterium]